MATEVLFSTASHCEAVCTSDLPATQPYLGLQIAHQLVHVDAVLGVRGTGSHHTLARHDLCTGSAVCSLGAPARRDRAHKCSATRYGRHTTGRGANGMDTEVAGALGDATALMASTGLLAARTVFMVLDWWGCGGRRCVMQRVWSCEL